MYMSSQCTNDGNYTLTVTFKPGTDLNIAQVLVQNRESLAEPILPDLVKRRGISVKKKSPNVLMIVNLYSPDNSRDNLDLSNYATIQLRDELSRLPGVGDITYLGQRDYSMRLWLDPQKLAALQPHRPGRDQRAFQQQNIQVAAGQIGQPPAPNGQVFQYTMTTLGRLENTEQFGDIVLKNDVNGRLVHMRDVANIELGAQSYDQTCTLDGKPSVALSIYQLPGSNALEVAQRVKSRMKELKAISRQASTTTSFTTPRRSSTNRSTKSSRPCSTPSSSWPWWCWFSCRTGVRRSFRWSPCPSPSSARSPSWRPMGFSLNNLTLSAWCWPSASSWMTPSSSSRPWSITSSTAWRRAKRRSRRWSRCPARWSRSAWCCRRCSCRARSSAASSGQFFRQFALTIAVSTIISAFNSLTLSPALSALLLRPREKGSFEALPRLALSHSIGAWLGHKIGLHWLMSVLAALHLHRSPTVANALAPLAGLPIGVAAALARTLVGPGSSAAPLNLMLGWSFRTFNCGFDYSTGVYTRRVSACCCASASWCCSSTAGCWR